MKPKWPVLLLLLFLAVPAAVQAQFTYTTNNGAITLTQYNGTGGAVVISNFVTIIGQNAFANKSSLSSITIPAGVTNIGEAAFYYCPGLTTITIPNGVTSIEDDTFFSCSRLTNVTVSPNLASIGYEAFFSCGLSSFPIPGSVTNIGDYAFGFNGLTNIWIGPNVTSIGVAPFDGCVRLPAIAVDSGNLFYCSVDGVLFNQSLSTLIQYPAGNTESYYTIPNSVTSIGDHAFYGCQSLANVTIPASVSTIGDFAFSGCPFLGQVEFEGNAPSADSTVFDTSAPVFAYYLPCTTGWSAFSSTFSSLTGLQFVEANFVIFTANPSSGVAPLTVDFTSPAIDGCGNFITNLTWHFGDGATSTVQNPSHTYAVPGNYSPFLAASNNAGGRVGGLGPSITVGFNSGLVQNGAFETGDFSGWTLSGNYYNSFVSDGPANLADGGLFLPVSGNYTALLGAGSPLGYLSQILSTTAGASYLLSFWFANPQQDPSQFLVSWNGTSLSQTTNPNANNWTNMQFVVSATGASSLLQFGFQDYYNWLALVDISVLPCNPNIAGFEMSGVSLVINGVNGLSGTTYYLLMSTNPALPFSQWTPVATNVLSASGYFTITATNAVSTNSQQGFYILQTQ